MRTIRMLAMGLGLGLFLVGCVVSSSCPLSCVPGCSCKVSAPCEMCKAGCKCGKECPCRAAENQKAP